MNAEIWIIIAQIAIPSIIALLAAGISSQMQIRAMRQIANPTLNQPKLRIADAVQLFQKIKPFIFPTVGFIATLYSLSDKLLSDEPLTRISVFFIAFYTAMLILYVSLGLTTFLVFKILKQLDNDENT